MMVGRSVLDLKRLKRIGDGQSLTANASTLARLSGQSSITPLGAIAHHLFLSIQIDLDPSLEMHQLARLWISESTCIVSGTLADWRSTLADWETSEPELCRKVRIIFISQGLSL